MAEQAPGPPLSASWLPLELQRRAEHSPCKANAVKAKNRQRSVAAAAAAFFPPAASRAPCAALCRLEDAFVREMQRLGGAQQARPKQLLDALAPQFPDLGLQLPNIKVPGRTAWLAHWDMPPTSVLACSRPSPSHPAPSSPAAAAAVAPAGAPQAGGAGGGVAGQQRRGAGPGALAGPAGGELPAGGAGAGRPGCSQAQGGVGGAGAAGLRHADAAGEGGHGTRGALGGRPVRGWLSSVVRVCLSHAHY